MNIFTKLYLTQHVIKWRLTWAKHNCAYSYTRPDNPKFMGSLDAVKTFVKDGSVVALTGLAGNLRSAILYYAVREVFEKTGHPRDLTLMCCGGIGGRGKVPGSLEELGLEGICKRFVAGHLETFKAFLKLADKGKLELQCLPQGVVAMLFEALSRGEDSIVTSTGVGTFIDPRVGRGSPVVDPNAEQLVTVEGDQLRYRLPAIDVAMFGAPAADKEGNIYMKGSTIVGDVKEITKAAKLNGGKVIVNVGKIVEKGYGDIFIPADMVDAIVYDPDTEQVASIKYRKGWNFLTTDSKYSVDEAISRLRYVSQRMGVTPVRTPLDATLARLAATIFAENAHKGLFVNIGVGLPEEVCRLIYEGGLFNDITLLTESGVLGGLPAPGLFFGGAANPKQLVSPAEVFKICHEKLDVTILGALQVDGEGNVNVSKRGEGAINYVGPGGFIDLVTAAKWVVFVTSWMTRGEIQVDGDKLKVIKKGKPKFIEKVDEITFNGKGALEAGKKVFYVTNVGVFQLTERGLELIRVMPGIDIQKDIIEFAPIKIVLPEDGKVPVIDSSVITGNGFKLAFSK